MLWYVFSSAKCLFNSNAYLTSVLMLLYFSFVAEIFNVVDQCSFPEPVDFLLLLIMDTDIMYWVTKIWRIAKCWVLGWSHQSSQLNFREKASSHLTIKDFKIGILSWGLRSLNLKSIRKKCGQISRQKPKFIVFLN